jgi:hypothetical protein
MTEAWHPLVKQVLDGELPPAALPPELRREAETALRALRELDRTPVALSADVERRVMTDVRRRAAAPGGLGVRLWRWLDRPREIRVRVRPWALGPALAAAAALLLVLSGSPPAERGAGVAAAQVESAFVRFVLFAPEARHVAVAGTFNAWDPSATPLAPGGAPGVWITTVALPIGQHQYAFVLDGRRWVADPAAPRVDDGFGRANSLLAIVAGGRAL